MAVHNFLLIYDRTHRHLATVQQFANREKAARMTTRRCCRGILAGDPQLGGPATSGRLR
jgi:hypothetical protein